MFKQDAVVKVDMADLDDQKESLANFLRKHLKLESSLCREGLEVVTGDVSSYELVKMVNKFISSKGFNLTHWVSVSGDFIKINRFNKKKGKENKHPVGASTIRHGW